MNNNKTLTVTEVEAKLATFDDCNSNFWRETPYDPMIIDSMFAEHKEIEDNSWKEYLTILINDAVTKLKRNKKLSKNQQKCFKYFMKGKTTSEMSKLMNVSAPTVLNYLERVFEKIPNEVNLIFLQK